MKLYIVDKENNENHKCGSCNWQVTNLYLLADTQKEANKISKKLIKQGFGPGLCGDCMGEMLTEEQYDISK